MFALGRSGALVFVAALGGSLLAYAQTTGPIEGLRLRMTDELKPVESRPKEGARPTVIESTEPVSRRGRKDARVRGLVLRLTTTRGFDDNLLKTRRDEKREFYLDIEAKATLQGS